MRAMVGTVTMLFLLGGIAASAQAVDELQGQPGAAASDTMTLPPSVSQVRIVRLSQVRGEVQLDRNIGRGYEDAFANIPIVHGSKLMTGQGEAEIEFEDNSTVRLAPGSKVSFEQLGRSASGATLSTVKVLQGTVYVSLAKSKDDLFMLEDGQARVLVSPGSHVRLQADTQARLAVFDGAAQVETAAGPTGVVKKQTAQFDPAAATAPVLVAKTEPLDADAWDKTQQDYHRRSSGFTGSGLAPGAGLYGGNDLNYYGQFSNLGGCGSVWRPYFAGAGWDPFANGSLAYYQGAGYSWVSPYPWGWLPFHSGAWQQCGGGVWGWRPGGQWYGLSNTALNTSSTRFPRTPVKPGPHEPTLLTVNARPIAPSGVSKPDTFTFRNDSAGLGIPRESFGKLSHLSASAERHGSATSWVPVAAPGVGAAGTSVAGPSSGRSGGHTAAGPSAQSNAFASSRMSSMSGSSAGGASHGSAGGGHH